MAEKENLNQTDIILIASEWGLSFKYQQ